MIKDATGFLQENEAILVSGAPHWLEGKILSVSELIDEDGQPTSTKEVQAHDVLIQIREWEWTSTLLLLYLILQQATLACTGAPLSGC